MQFKEREIFKQHFRQMQRKDKLNPIQREQS